VKAIERCESCAPFSHVLACLHLADGGGSAEDAKKEGAELARMGVPVECASLAIEKYVEACAASRSERHPSGGKQLLELERTASEYRFALLAGYSEHLDSERRALEQQVEEVEALSREKVNELREVYEQDRRRLAQDLHDEVGHDLIVLKLYVEMIARDLGYGDPSKVRRKLNESVKLIQHAIKGVRHLTFALGPTIWNSEGFVSAMRLYVRQFAARMELKARFNARRLKAQLSPEYEQALYKALQGALANVAAHSGAKEVNVSLSSDNESVHMMVADDGKGFNVQSKLKLPQRSFGLRAMRERIEALGGTIQFRSVATKIGNGGSGTVVEFRLPLDPVIAS